MSLRVLLIDARQAEASVLAAVLTACGFQVIGSLQESDEVLPVVRRLEPDAIIIDADSPRRDTLEGLARLSRRYPRPMIMLSEQGDADLTRTAADAGVSAYVVEGVSSETIRSLVQVAVMHFRGQHVLHAELSKTRQELEDRRQIDRAKCRLMEHYGLNEKAAYERLRSLAMTRGQRLAELARLVLASPGLA
ncbi:MAG: ANTAR domain-containing response regulator [Nevskiales bacterium]